MLMHCAPLHVYPEGVSDRCQGYLQALQGRPAGPSSCCQGRSCRIDAPRRIGSAPTRCQAGACRVRLASADLLPLPELPRIRDTMPRRTAAAACRKWMRCLPPAACRIAPRIPSNRQIWRAYTHPAARIQHATHPDPRRLQDVPENKGDYRGIIVIARQYLPLHKTGRRKHRSANVPKKNEKNLKKGLT